MKKVIGLILFIIILTSTLTSCYPGWCENSLEDFFAEWTAEEIDMSVAFWDRNDRTFYFSDGTAHKPNPYLYHYRLVIKDGLLYVASYDYLDDEEYDLLVSIRTYNFETGEVKTIYSVKVCPMDANGEHIGYGYSKIYYCNSEIVIRDGASTVVFNINTHTAEYLPPEEKETPVSDYEITRIKDDKGYNDLNKVVIKKGDEQRIIDINYMASRNDYARMLTEIEHRRKFFSYIEDPLRNFFSDAEVINDKIYLLCKVLDEDGETNSVVFSYHYETDKFNFLFNIFDQDAMQIDVVPVEQTNN